MIRNSIYPSWPNQALPRYKYVRIDYDRVINKFSELCSFIDNGCDQSQIVEYFSYLMGSYFSYGATGMRLSLFEELGNADDYLEIDKGDHVLEIVEMMDIITRYWLPGYSVFGFDKRMVTLEEARGTFVILKIDQQHLKELTRARCPSDSSRLFD